MRTEVVIGHSTVLHLVFFNFNVSVPPEEDVVQSGMARLRTIDGVESLIVARSITPDASHAMASLVYLTDPAALESYASHSLHRTYARETFLPAVHDLVVGDFDVHALPPERATLIHPFFVFFKDGAAVTAMESFRDGLMSLADIPGVGAVHAGESIGTMADYTFGGCIFFDSPLGLETYGKHPLHERFVAEHWSPLVANSLSIVAAAGSLTP